MHLADAFIQSDLQCIQAIHYSQYVCSRPFALLTQCSTTEPQERIQIKIAKITKLYIILLCDMRLYYCALL